MEGIKRGFEAEGRGCLDRPPTLVLLREALLALLGTTKHSQQQETSVSEAEIKAGAEGKKEATASNQIKQQTLTAEGGNVLVYLMEYKAGYLYGVL